MHTLYFELDEFDFYYSAIGYEFEVLIILCYYMFAVSQNKDLCFFFLPCIRYEKDVWTVKNQKNELISIHVIVFHH